MTPIHASNPPWADKTDDEKKNALATLAQILATYKKEKQSPVTSVSFSLNDSDPETVRQTYLHQLNHLLSPDLEHLSELLEKLMPEDDKEAKDKQQACDFIQRTPLCFNMFCAEGHFTGSALILHRETKSVLLHYHKKLNRLLQFGGHADFETNLAQVARREAEEETGLTDLLYLPAFEDQPDLPLDLDIHQIPERKNIAEHSHYDLRYCFETQNKEAVNPGEGESTNFHWIAIDQALDPAFTDIDQDLKRLIRKAARLIETP